MFPIVTQVQRLNVTAAGYWPIIEHYTSLKGDESPKFNLTVARPLSLLSKTDDNTQRGLCSCQLLLTQPDPAQLLLLLRLFLFFSILNVGAASPPGGAAIGSRRASVSDAAFSLAFK